MIIDSHQHFWHYSPESHDWISDEMSILKRDFLPQDLELILQKNHVDGCIAVQAEQSEHETIFLNKLATKFDFIKGVVGWVDLRAQNIESRLEYFSQFEKIKGYRHIIQSEPDPNFMLLSEFQNGISQLEDYNVTYDLLLFPNQLQAAIQLVKKFPNQRFVIDHLAKPYIKSKKINNWETDIKQIALHENVYCKLSGIVTEASWNSWNDADIRPYLDVVFSAFGTDRLLFGSDWPVCLLAASYGKAMDIIIKYIQKLSKAEIENIMGKNALHFYNIK